MIGLVLLIPTTTRRQKPISRQVVCMNYCNLRGLQCYGYIEKSIYDGTNESDKLIDKQEFMVCFEPKTELEPLL